NAGIQRIHPITEFPIEDWRLINTLMLEAPFVLTKAALPKMCERGWGRIINLSSIHGLRASPNKSAYVAAKHGLMGLTKATRSEEHTSELQSRFDLVCRLLLEKKQTLKSSQQRDAE